MGVCIWIIDESPCFFKPVSQPLVPRENITAWMNAIGLVITALPVRRTVPKTSSYSSLNSCQVKLCSRTPASSPSGALLDCSPRPHRLCDWLSGSDIRDGVGRLSLCLARLYSLPPELQRDELQLRASISARRLASLLHRTALSDSQVMKSSSRFSALVFYALSLSDNLCFHVTH